MSELSIMPLLRRRPMLVRMMALYALSQVAVGILAPTVRFTLTASSASSKKTWRADRCSGDSHRADRVAAGQRSR
jgi:hypothetical protein